MLYWRWFNRPRHPLLRIVAAMAGLVVVAAVLALGFFALLAFAFIGAIVALTRLVARSHADAAGVARPQAAAQSTRVIEGEYIVVDSHPSAPR
ncbi:MAG TPA: hypothetical protein VFB32_14215 [Rudaea sp.]|nr:hypothetical protein [Rudaea sp.]